MTKRNYILQEVFVPVGLPDLTFVKRDDLERAIKSWEINQHKHLLIFGASKTGKTSLWKRYIAPDRVIKIPCNNATSIESLYTEILEKLGGYFSKTQTIETGKRNSLLGEIKALIPWIGGSARVQGTIEEHKTETLEREYSKPTLNASTIIRFLKEADKIVVVEDFHYTSDDFRRQLSEDLKAFSDEKCPWIIVGVQHKTSNLLSFNIDLSQRIAEIPIENFSESQLLELIDLGELALNIKFEKSIKHRLLEESNGSASILQNICQRICMIKGIYNTSE